MEETRQPSHHVGHGSVPEDPAVVEERHMRTQALGAEQVMRRQEDGPTLVTLFPQHAFHVAAGLGVEGLHWLVQDHHRGVAGNGLGEEQLALHAVAQGADAAVGWHAQRLQECDGPVDVGLRVIANRERDQFPRLHPVIERGFRGGIPDPSSHGDGLPSRIEAVDRHFAIVGMNHAHETLQERRLAGAIGSDEAVDGAGLDLDRDPTQHGRVSIGLGEIVGADHGRAGYVTRGQLMMAAVMTERQRCPWCGTDPQYVAYHDEEWGVPVRDDAALFAKLTLDTFQSGLSWLVILRKRDGILAAMDDLDPVRLATWDSRRIERVLQDERIIRNRGKVVAAVNNARCYVELSEAGRSFSELLWAHVGGKTIINARGRLRDIVDRTAESESMAKELKKLGFKWTGPVVVFSVRPVLVG